jgi:hypothetical protein
MVRQFCCAKLRGFPRPVVAQNSTGQRREAVDFHDPTSVTGYGDDSPCHCFDHRLPLSRPRRARTQTYRSSTSIGCSAPTEPWLSPAFTPDWLLWLLLCRIWASVVDAMVPVKPAIVIEWHRKGFRFYWRWRSRRPGWPPDQSRNL